MLKLLSVLVISTITTACTFDEVVSTDIVKVGTTTEKVSCNAGPGFCMACGLNLTGGFDCMPKLKVSCPGKQEAVVDVYQVTKTWANGDITTSVEKQIVEVIGECK